MTRSAQRERYAASRMTFMGVIMKHLVRVLCLVVFSCAHAQSLPVAIRGVTVVDVRDGCSIPNRRFS